MDYIITLDDWLKYVSTLPVIERKEVLNIYLPRSKKTMDELKQDARADMLNRRTGENKTPLEWAMYENVILKDDVTGIEISLI